MGEPTPAAPAWTTPAEEAAPTPVAEPTPPSATPDSDGFSPLPQSPEPRLDMEPRAAAAEPRPEPKPEPKAEPEPAKAPPAVDEPPQGDLGDLAPKGGLDKDVQEDLLEIPAFLRRQAN
jgi:fused signal recognition particle receptor